MIWNDGHVWTLTVGIPADADVEFKLVVASSHTGEGKEWERGDNRTVRAGPGDASVELEWGKMGRVRLGDGAAASPAHESVYSDGSYASDSYASSDSDSAMMSMDERAPTAAWQGKDVTFMQNNDHSRERSGMKWDTNGLEGAALTLVQGDEHAANWLKKLKVLEQLLVDESEEMRPGLDALAYGYVYMQWISTGALQCVEGGGHYRPNHHANIAKRMFRSLEWVLGDDYLGSAPQESLIARRLSKLLPSFDARFTASVPLTRIRDIAHRSDIPHDLKREIKHTLQNKLHRNAGPEDLVATEAMLERITANPGEYNDAFVSEFKIFTQELRDFFGAGSLASMLDELRPAMDDPSQSLLDGFVAAKNKLDAAGPHDVDPNLLMDCLHRLTTVRALLAAGLSSGLRNDAPDKAMAMRQKWRRAELRSEDYAFVLLSRLLSAFVARGGADAIAKGNSDAWGLPVGACVLGVRQLGLSGWAPPECMAVENEMEAWHRAGMLTEADEARRMLATLDRLARLSQSYVDTLLQVTGPRAKTLGSALGVPDWMAGVFPEAEVRASVVFQVTQIATLLRSACKQIVSVGAWDAVVSGDVTGILVEVDAITPEVLKEHSDTDVVLLVKGADGDEELAAGGSNLRGILLCQDIPHLSHLGVRARQEKVLFATCPAPDAVNESARPLVGKPVRVRAGPGGVSVEECSMDAVGCGTRSTAEDKAGGSAGPAAPAAQPAAVDLSRAGRVLDTASTTVATGGAKAAACAELAATAGAPDAEAAGIHTPCGATIPFGTLELAIEAAGRTQEFEALLEGLENSNGALDGRCNDIRELVLGCPPPEEVLEDIAARFEPGTPLMVRSSANVEDLAGMSGAGLYESVANAYAHRPEGLGQAICEVWASLYSRRAVLSRAAAGVAPGSAHMGVLIQEMLTPTMSFVLHTVDPLSADPDLVSAEIAVGMGETLASAAEGSPWRMTVDKRGEQGIKMTSFANISTGYVPHRSRFAQPAGYGGASETVVASEVVVQQQVVDYSRQVFSRDEDTRKAIGAQLASIATYLETRFGAPQDVEGCVLPSGKIYIVQSRPQPI